MLKRVYSSHEVGFGELAGRRSFKSSVVQLFPHRIVVTLAVIHSIMVSTHTEFVESMTVVSWLETKGMPEEYYRKFEGKCEKFSRIYIPWPTRTVNPIAIIFA